MIRAYVCVLVLLVGGLVAWSSPAHAEDCSIQVGILGANSTCAWTYADYQASSSSGDSHTWVVTLQCANGGICADHVECNEDGQSGFVHDVYMDGADVGDVCVPNNEIDEVNIAQLITREFKRISWPASLLVVQPPGGKTLVNLATNFYTDDESSIAKDLRLASRAVTIEATPTTYTFWFGDETSMSTSSPGEPYPSLDVAHTYARTGRVGVSLDTTYSGRFRVGGGDWVTIPETVTVAGTAQDLEIVEALPQLVLE